MTSLTSIIEELEKNPGEAFLLEDKKLLLLGLPDGKIAAITGDFTDATDEELNQRIQVVLSNAK